MVSPYVRSHLGEHMTVKIIKGDCRDLLRTLPDESVHCCISSPPYWGLRDYGTAQWNGGDAGCDHVKGKARQDNGERTWDGGPIQSGPLYFTAICGKCGARRIDSQLGLERSLGEHVEVMTEVFREVRRVLRRDGTCWINYGDAYASSVNGRKAADIVDDDRTFRDKPFSTIGNGLKPKDLCGVPWRIAFALQADGWYLRQDIIWSKPNPMPESVRDRCTKAHEYIFLLSKSERYYYDADAIREENSERYQEPTTWERHGQAKTAAERRDANGINANGANAARFNGLGRNKRSVWEIATAPFSSAHFATFPPALIEPCILAGCPKECCARCGAPWVREVERTAMVIDRSNRTHDRGQTRSSGTMIKPPTSKTLGWLPSCSCTGTNSTPGTVLDPFGGAGTTGLVADRLGRNAILIELNPQYAEMAERRIRDDAGMFAQVAAE